MLVVQKAPGANVLAVSHEIDAAIASLKPGLPQIAFDTSLFRDDTYLNSSLGNLRTALIIGGILMAVALLALLLSLRLAFTALAGVALSFVAATALVSLLGYSFNSLVTLGLLLALGFVVTEAAGSAQAIVSRRRADAASPSDPGRSRITRVERGVAAASGELRGALAGAGVAALVCVVPLLIATGLTASFLRPMALALFLGIAVSMVVAVTVTPALAVLVMAVGPRARTATGTPATGLAALPARAGAAYRRGVTRVAAAPKLAALCLGLTAAAGVAALAALPFVHANQPQFADRSLVMRLSGAPGMSLPELSRMTSLVTGELRTLPSVQSVGATLGRATNSDQVENVNTGELWITLKPDASYGQASSQITAIADGTPGLTGTVSTYEADSMTGVLASGASTVVTRVYGVNGGELAVQAGRLSGAVARIPGVTGTTVTTPVTQPTIDISVNLDAAARYGISPGDVRREAGTLLSGLTVGNYFENQAVFDVVVWGLPANRSSLSSIENLLIDTANGGHVRLGQVATVARAAAAVRHPAGGHVAVRGRDRDGVRRLGGLGARRHLGEAGRDDVPDQLPRRACQPHPVRQRPGGQRGGQPAVAQRQLRRRYVARRVHRLRDRRPGRDPAHRAGDHRQLAARAHQLPGPARLPVRRGARHVRHRPAGDARRRGGAARGLRARRAARHRHQCWQHGARGCAPVPPMSKGPPLLAARARGPTSGRRPRSRCPSWSPRSRWCRSSRWETCLAWNCCTPPPRSSSAGLPPPCSSAWSCSRWRAASSAPAPRLNPTRRSPGSPSRTAPT